MSLELTAKLHQASFQAGQPQSVYALLDFQPAAALARLPLDLRLALDVSGSMSDKANAGELPRADMHAARLAALSPQQGGERSPQQDKRAEIGSQQQT